MFAFFYYDCLYISYVIYRSWHGHAFGGSCSGAGVPWTKDFERLALGICWKCVVYGTFYACYTLKNRRYTPLYNPSNFAQLHISDFSRSHFEDGWFHFFHGRQCCYKASERITWRQSQHERSSWAPLDDRHTEVVKRSWKRYVITRRSSKCSLVNRHETPVKETMSLVSKDLRIVQKGESANNFCICQSNPTVFSRKILLMM